jgi:hypothetical protein
MIIMIDISKVRRADSSCFRWVDRKIIIKMKDDERICSRKFIALRVGLNLWITRPML